MEQAVSDVAVDITKYDLLLTGLVIFLVFHLAAGVYEVRKRLVPAMGLGGYRILHSFFAILALGMIVLGFQERPMDPLYTPPVWSQWAAVLTMPVAFILLVGAYASRATMRRVARHPMLAGVLLWSITHMLANGDKASFMIFFTFGTYSVVAMWLGDRKLRLGEPEKWEQLKAETSNVPFLAIIQGRAVPATGDRGVRAIVWGLLVYAVVALAHPYFIGVPAFPA